LFWRFGVQVLTAGGGELKNGRKGALLRLSSPPKFLRLVFLIFFDKVLDSYIANVVVYQ
jgi:hypothetical protein